MTAARQKAASTQDRTLLSLANWGEARGEGEAAAAAKRPQVGPLLAALSKTAAAPQPASPARSIAAPTLLDLLRADGGRPSSRAPRRGEDGASPRAPIAADTNRKSAQAAPSRAAHREDKPSGRGASAPSRLRWLAAPALAAVGALAGYIMAGDTLYSARAELIMKPELVRGADGFPAAPAPAPQVPAAAVERSMARLTTQQVLEPVVDALSLTQNTEFGAGDRATAVARLAQRVSASPQGAIPGYTVTATATDATLSGDIANAVAEALAGTHDLLEAGPPPTRLEVAYQAMPGTAAPTATRAIPAAIGGAAGFALGLLLAIAAGRLTGLRPILPARGMRPASPRQPRGGPGRPPAAAAVPARHPAPQPRLPAAKPPQPARAAPVAAPAAPAAKSRRPAPQAPTRVYTPVRAAQPYAVTAVAAAEPSRPRQEPAMYPQHPHAPTGAYPQATTPGPAFGPAPANGWWPQPTAHPQFAPAAYPQPMAPHPQAYAPQTASYPQPWPSPAQPLYPPAVPPMAAMPQYAAPSPYAPAPQPAVHHYPVAVPFPVPYPVPTPIHHEPAHQAAPSSGSQMQNAADDTAELQAAIDEVRAQLRAFAGSLDVLKAARSA